MRYITDADKTVNGLYVSSYGCRADSTGASEDFRAVRSNGTGRTKILAHHIIQSFEHGEITPEKAMQVSEELCDKLLEGNYQYVLAVHTDKEHIHSHIIFNNTNMYNGLSFTTEKNQGKVKERSWAKLREISDEICEKYGLSVIEENENSKGVSHYEHEMQKEGKSWKAKLKSMLSELIKYSPDFDTFLRNCERVGIEAVYTPNTKNKLKFRMQGQERFTRAKTLGEKFTAENIIAALEKLHKPMENAVADAVVTKPTEKPIEKPVEEPVEEVVDEDVWSAVRGMGNAEQMIRELEAGGVHSYKELYSFMWEHAHSDDHTKELDVLDKKIKDVNALVKKAQHYDELYKVYKENKKLTGLKGKIYAKKHAEELEDFHKTANYLQKAVKKYNLPGNANRTLELQSLLIKLRDEYNALVPEHNAFLLKKETASKYTRKVRSYLADEHNKREREQSIKRTQNRRRSGFSLE
ncbi:MAG: relaxase/mobilization nuclease domain-containing protein [Oscillospiraceae bacterium]|nr:relaxase/mobilization nuclease domain-containing protein [Oscillospiraceae bacterium]